MKSFAMNRIKYLFVAFALLSTTSLLAQKKWTLEECISYALQNNIQLKRSDLQTRIAEKSYQQGYFNLAPSVNGSFYHEYSNGNIYNQWESKFVNIENQSGSIGLNAEIELFKGLSNYNNIAKLKYELLAQRENGEIQRNSLTLNIVASYLQILYDNENLVYNEELYNTLQKQLQRFEKQSELGSVSLSDMLNVKAQVINQKAQLTSAKNKLILSNLELAQLLDIELVDSFRISTNPISVDVNSAKGDFNSQFLESVDKRPELRKAEYDLKAARKDLNMAYGGISPRVVLGYTVGSGYDRTAWYRKISGGDTTLIKYPDYTYKEQLNNNVSSRIYLSVQIPIFQKLTNATRISKAKINYLDAKFSQEESKKKVVKELQQAYADAIASYDRYLSFQESVVSYGEVYNQAKQKFDLGMINSVDFEIARNNLTKAQGELLHAKYTYLLKLKILDFYRGIPITL